MQPRHRAPCAGFQEGIHVPSADESKLDDQGHLRRGHSLLRPLVHIHISGDKGRVPRKVQVLRQSQCGAGPGSCGWGLERRPGSAGRRRSRGTGGTRHLLERTSPTLQGPEWAVLSLLSGSVHSSSGVLFGRSSRGSWQVQRGAGQPEPGGSPSPRTWSAPTGPGGNSLHPSSVCCHKQ